MAKFVTGDSKPYSVVLKINDLPIVGGIPTDTVIRAQIVALDRKKVLTTEPLTILSTVPASDWANSTIVIKFPRASTKDISITSKDGFIDALIEIQATFSAGEDDWSWFLPIELYKGNLD